MMAIRFQVVVGCVVSCLLFHDFRLVEGQAQQNASAQNYLHQFGYIDVDPRTRTAQPVDLRRALIEFQQFTGLPVTGTLDSQTVAKMQSPRCGNPDKEKGSFKRRRKRYKLNNSKWSKRLLTYRMSSTQTTARIPSNQLEQIFRRAFQMWSNVANIRFVERKHGTADILLLFGRRNHGDSYPFDGRGQTLAHAFSPRSGGDVHFDDDEPWSYSFSSGRSLLTVATHEIGHSLGLSHSENRGAIMAPYYKAYTANNFRLHSDDINGMQHLYGRPVSTSTTSTTTTTTTTASPTTPTTTTTRPPRRVTTLIPWWLRTTRGWPAIRQTTAGLLSCYWWQWWCRQVPVVTPGWATPTITRTTTTTTTTTTTATTPTTTRTTTTTRRPVNSLPAVCQMGDIDAIISPPGSAYTYAFKGNLYMKLVEDGVVPGYPKPSNTQWSGVNGVDAAMTLNEQGQTITYLFTRWMVKKFRSDFTQIGRHTILWQEFPGLYVGYIDAAFQWNNRIYIFVGARYYKLRADKRVETGYPRPISTWGLPSNVQRVNAVTTWAANNQVYFFVGNNYYKYDEANGRVADATSGPSYPRATARFWFGC